MTSTLDTTAATTPPRLRRIRTRFTYAAALGVLGLGAAIQLAGSADGASAKAAAKTNDPKFAAHVAYSGGRRFDLRVGEPLVMTYHGEKIGRICWDPAPIESPQCSTAIAAAARAGTQKLQLEFDSGKTVDVTLRIGLAAPRLADNVAESTLPDAHPIVMKATCSIQAYANFSRGKLRDPIDGVTLEPDDRIAAYYRAGMKAIEGFGYANHQAAFYPSHCLEAN